MDRSNMAQGNGQRTTPVNVCQKAGTLESQLLKDRDRCTLSGSSNDNCFSYRTRDMHAYQRQRRD